MQEKAVVIKTRNEKHNDVDQGHSKLKNEAAEDVRKLLSKAIKVKKRRVKA